MPRGVYDRKKTKKAKRAHKRLDIQPVDKWTELMKRIQDYADAQQEDSWKGGGDPDAIPVIEAQLVLARAKLEQYIGALQRAEE